LVFEAKGFNSGGEGGDLGGPVGLVVGPPLFYCCKDFVVQYLKARSQAVTTTLQVDNFADNYVAC